MISPLDSTLRHWINHDSPNTPIGFGSNYSVDSDAIYTVLDNTILCHDNSICFSGTCLSDLCAGQHYPFDKSLCTG